MSRRLVFSLGILGLLTACSNSMDSDEAPINMDAPMLDTREFELFELEVMRQGLSNADYEGPIEGYPIGTQFCQLSCPEDPDLGEPQPQPYDPANPEPGCSYNVAHQRAIKTCTITNKHPGENYGDSSDVQVYRVKTIYERSCDESFPVDCVDPSTKIGFLGTATRNTYTRNEYRVSRYIASIDPDTCAPTMGSSNTCSGHEHWNQENDCDGRKSHSSGSSQPICNLPGPGQ